MPSKKYLNEVGLAYFWEKIKSLANDVYLYSKSYTDNKINNLNVVIDIAGNTAENADEDEYTSDEAYFLCRRYLQDGKDWHTPYTNSEISDLLGSNSDTEVHIRFEHPETYAVITMRLYSDLYTNNNTYYFIAPTEEGCYYASNSFNGTGIDPDANAYIDIYYNTYDSASDWEQDDSTSKDYIQNRPAIKAGEGTNSVVVNDTSNLVASGEYSYAEGSFTISSGNYQHVQGKYNIADNSSTYAHIVGNGTSNSARSNAHTLDWSGNGWYAGKLTVGSAPTADMDVATKIYVDNLAATAEDDEEILNLLTEYGYYAPVTDADGNVVTDIDNNIILG